MKENREEKLGLMHAAYKMRRLNIGSLLGDVLQSEYFTMEAVHHFQQSNQGAAGIYVSDLAKRMNMASSATSRLLHTLEEKQWISREVDRNDRRNTYVCLTEKGQEVRDELAEKLNLYFDRVIMRMGPDEVRHLIQLWNTMSDIMADELYQSAKSQDGPETCGR